MALLLPLRGSSVSPNQLTFEAKSGEETIGTLFQTLVCCAGGQHKSVRGGRGGDSLARKQKSQFSKLGSLTERARWFFDLPCPAERMLEFG